MSWNVDDEVTWIDHHYAYCGEIETLNENVVCETLTSTEDIISCYLFGEKDQYAQPRSVYISRRYKLHACYLVRRAYGRGVLCGVPAL